MNRSQLTQFRTRARVVSESLFPATIRLGDSTTDLAASTSGISKRQQLVPGMFLQQEAIRFRIRKDLLAAMPEPGTALVWLEGDRQTRLLIVSVNNSAEQFYTLGCEAPPQ